jgi:hypothetical protein
MTSARIERVGEGEAGQILTSFRLRLGLMMTLAPLVVSPNARLGLCRYTIYRVKILHALASIVDAAAGLGGIVPIISGFWCTSRFGNFVPMRYLHGEARSVKNCFKNTPAA